MQALGGRHEFGGSRRILTSVRWGRKEGCWIREWAFKWASVKGRGGCPPTQHSLSGGLLVYGGPGCVELRTRSLSSRFSVLGSLIASRWQSSGPRPASVLSGISEEDQGCHCTPHAGAEPLCAGRAKGPGLPVLRGNPRATPGSCDPAPVLLDPGTEVGS